MKKLLSIIIPSYNMEGYLDRCISSLLIKRIDDLDIIIINDGSKDRTSEIGHKYENLYPNSIRCIDKENGNYGSCINRGLSEVKGKYVKILDADDSFNTYEFERMIEAISNTDTDLVICDYDIVDADGNITKKIRADNSMHIGYDDVNFFNIEKSLEFPYFQMHAICYNSSIFKELNYKQTEGISYTDQEWMFLPMSKVHSVRYLPFVVYKYLIGRDGQTVDIGINLKNLNQTFIVINNLINNYNITLDKLDQSHLSYLEYRITLLLESTYLMCILKYPQVNILNNLKDFDCNLKILNVDFFKVLNEEYTVFGIKYIKLWRKNNYKLPIYLKILSSIIKGIILIKSRVRML